MEPERWERVKALFESARSLPADRRAAWLAGACDDAALVSEVEALLAAYEDDPGFLEAPVAATKAGEALRQQIAGGAEGRVIGAYRIVRDIGRGGMGVVYEAEHSGEGFSRRVAVKLLPAGWSASTLAERFRFERQVLAGLDHPGIARFYDAGTTDDGAPYFVMEYVDGQPIDAWSRARALAVRPCVELMVRVCDAVVHAHRNFVVHRDLKPANILVTGDGQPKLLDFGIARLLSDEASASPGLTRTGQYAFTPEYASPEQVRGAAITTASDVYSLGMLLYLLLTGTPAYALSGLGPMDAMKAVCEAEPPLPSLAAQEPARSALRGDLDHVIAKALRKDPAERYPTVAALAADLRAWLEGRVVSATPATAWYRTRKALGRHKVAAIAAGAVVLALAAGGVTTAWQARLARLERDRAERRLVQVRQFADSLLFEVHDALRALPGATEPRRLLLERAVRFLDGLAQDAGEDNTFKLELAEAYRRLGHVQGSSRTENIGNPSAARASFEKAARLCEEVLGAEPGSVPAALAATNAYDDLASSRLDAGDADGAEQTQRRHLAIVTRLEREHLSNPDVRRSIAGSYFGLGYFRGIRGDQAGAAPLYRKSIEIYRSLPAPLLDQDQPARGLAFALKRLGAVLLAGQQLKEAELCYREALALDEKVVGRNPGNLGYQFDMTYGMADLALIAWRKGDAAQAVTLYEQGLAVRQRVADADPKDLRAARGVASLHGYLAAAYGEQGRFDRQLTHRREQLRAWERLVPPAQHPTAPQIAVARIAVAGALLSASEQQPAPARQSAIAEARRLLEAGEPAARAAAAAGAGDRAYTLELLAEVKAHLKRLTSS